MTAKVILNPYSNRWNSQKRWPEAESALKAAGVDFDLADLAKKGQIVELAEQAVREKCSPIIVAGGDGSIGDAANGLMRAAAIRKETHWFLWGSCQPVPPMIWFMRWVCQRI